MSADDTTIKVYDAKYSDYAELTSGEQPDPSLERFVNMLPKGGRVLDLGCGPGKTTAFLQKAGFSVDAVDASVGMVQVAAEKYGVTVRCATFDDITGLQEYDGIWANFSLLHAPKSRLPGHLMALHTALKPGGVFHIGMKLGKGEHRDKLDRFYAYYSQTELENLLGKAGFNSFHCTFGHDIGLDKTHSDWIIISAHA
ncbi:MAG: class I SAM-dependent methyltransferase [Paracoccaceae bacterium]